MKSEVIKYLGGRFIPALVNLAVIILAIRFLGPVEYGRYSLLFFTVLLVITLTFHWVQVSVLRFLSGMPRESDVVLGRFYDLTILSAVCSTLLVAAAGYFYFRLDGISLVIVSLYAFLNHFFLFHQAVLHAYHKSIRTAILEGSDHVIILLALLTGIFFLEWRSAMVLFASYVVALAGVLVLRSLIRVKGLFRVNLRKIYWDSRFFSRVVDFGYGLALYIFLSHLVLAADRFLVGGLLGIREAGMYSAVKDLLFKTVTFASFPIYIAYQSKIQDHWNSRHRVNAWTAAKEALSFEILIFIVAFIVFMVVKKDLFGRLLGLPELDNWRIYLPLMLAAFLWQVAMLFQRFTELFYRTSGLLLALTVTVALNIAFNAMLIPHYGLIAAAMVLFCTSLLYSGLILILAWRAASKLDHPGR